MAVLAAVAAPAVAATALFAPSPGVSVLKHVVHLLLHGRRIDSPSTTSCWCDDAGVRVKTNGVAWPTAALLQECNKQILDYQPAVRRSARASRPFRQAITL